MNELGGGRDEWIEMECSVDVTIEAIEAIGRETINYINSCQSENFESYVNDYIESTKTCKIFLQDLKKNKSKNQNTIDDLEKKISLAQDEINKLNEEETYIKQQMAAQEKKLKTYKKQNLLLTKDKNTLAKQKTKIEVLQTLTDITILSEQRRKIYGLVGSEDGGKQKPFELLKTDDLVNSIHQLAKEVFEGI